MITTTYLKGCTWCDATGVKYPMHSTGTGFSPICPVCNGNKVVIATEVNDEDSDKIEELMVRIARYELLVESLKK
jgi:hypothetical protein